jgi:tRNA(fMet)-specific endonuclease VapC
MSTDFALIEAYSTIDAYSKGKAADPSEAHLPDSARNMGKNDLWVAATAHVLGATLFTTDKDFAHLDQTFLDLVIVS